MAQFQVSGTILDEYGKPIPFATIGFEELNETQAPIGDFSSVDGSFILKLEEGIYRLEIHMLGYASMKQDSIKVNQSIDLGIIKLETEVVELDEVVVRAERSYIQNELGKKTLYIGNDLASSGASATLALESLPSVSSNASGDISVRGSQNVIIYVNGRETKRDPKSLRFISADALKKIELITNPSAKYDAEGVAGIINIVYSSQKSTKLEIFGTLSAPYRSSGGINTSVSTDKLSYYLNMSQRDSRNEFRNSQIRSSPGDSLTRYENLISGVGTGSTRNISTGISFEPDTSSSFNLEMNYFRWDDRADEFQSNQFSYRNRVLEVDLVNATREVEDELSFSLSSEKKFSNGRNLQVQVTAGGEDEINEATFNREQVDISETPISIGAQNSNETEGQRYLQGKLDYTHPMVNSRSIEAGLVSDYFNFNVNQALSFYDDGQGVQNLFQVQMTKYGGYFLFEDKLKNLEYQVGMRYEHFRSNTTDQASDSTFQQTFRNLFPSLQLQHTLGRKDHTIGFNFTRRINRPSFWEMSPFFSYVDPLNLRRGNPFLKPEFANLFEVGYSNALGQWTMDVTFFRRATENVIQRFSSQLGEEQLFLSFENVGLRNDDGVEWSFTYDLSDAISFENTGTSYRTFFSETSEPIFFQQRWNWDFRTRARIKLGEDWRMDLIQHYRGPRYNIQSVSITQNYFHFTVQRTFSKKRGTIVLALRDITDNRVFGSDLQGEDFRLSSRYKWQTQVSTLTLRYKFIQ